MSATLCSETTNHKVLANGKQGTKRSVCLLLFLFENSIFCATLSFLRKKKYFYSHTKYTEAHAPFNLIAVVIFSQSDET